MGVIEQRLQELEDENSGLARDNARLQDQLRRNAEDARSVIDAQADSLDALNANGQPLPGPRRPGRGLSNPAPRQPRRSRSRQ